MNSLLFLLSLSPLLLLIDAATFYVNEESLMTPQTGSLTNPFTSITQASLSLGAITCDLALLGSSASISTTIVLTSGSNYIIRPDISFTSSAHFPIYLQPGAVIQTSSATLILQKLQFIELDLSRSTTIPFFNISTSSNLTFQSVLMRDARSTASFYYFCQATDSFVNILHSEFRNLTDFAFSLISSPIVVHGSTFGDISSTNVAFITLAYYTGPRHGFAFKNNSFQNITIGQTAQDGFIYSLASHINITFEDFSINNVTFNTETAFLAFKASSNKYIDTQNNQTTFTIKNGVIQNMLEKPKSALRSVTSFQYGLFAQNSGPTIFKIHNLSVTNSIFTNMTFISFITSNEQFLKTWKVLPYFELTDITLKDTMNVGLYILRVDTVNISNVDLEGLSIKGATNTRPVFYYTTGHLITVFNATAKSVTGPVFQSYNVLAQNYSNLSFNEMYTSKELKSGLQNVIFFSKASNFARTGLDPSRSQDTFFDNINLNGYTFIDGMNSAESVSDSTFIFGETIYGKVYLTNSVWYNNFMNGVECITAPYFGVNNLTIDNDPKMPREQIPSHKGFKLNIAKEIVFKNSIFQNNQNSVILHLYNPPRRSDEDQIAETFLTFENITVVNNSAVFYDEDSTYSSLFTIYCPMKPVNIFLRNSNFYNNTILNGLINAWENYQVKIDFTNNAFDSNYATQSAAVFSSRNMRQRTNILNLTNNTFTNNRCDQNGGAFSFILTDYNMHSVNNTYINNSAGLAGGLGYAFRASFVFLEDQGIYENNSAGTLGGVWYLSLNTYQANLQKLKFSQTSFVHSIAQQKGGSIYLENAGMTTDHCTFNGSQALLAGGDFYISMGKSINIIDTNFTASSALEGSFLYAEEVDGTLTINNVQMRDISSSGYMFAASSGSLNIKDSLFENISSSLFLLSDVTTLIKKTNFNKISCSKEFCLLKATSSNSIKITDSSLTNFNSDVDLISLSDCDQVLLSNLRIQNMLKLTQESHKQIFVLNVLNIQSLNIDHSDFSQIGFSGVKVKNTNLNAQDCTFSNRLQTDHRLLVQSTDDAKLEQLIQFMILDSSNSTLTGVSFIENSFNTLVDGGGVQILGLGGVHTLMNCIFEDNQAAIGGALLVKGQPNSISIINSQFENNQASENGGALFFADKSAKNSLLISQTTFFQNTATQGGAIYLGTQALGVDSSSFIGNNALRGGAIATMSASSKTLVDLRQTSFIRNNASEGAALIALNEMNFAYSTSSFKQNTAFYGGDVTSTPTSLRLRIYRFESYFLFIDNITAKDLLSNPSTVIIYDSATADASKFVDFISGAHPNLLFEITILDALGQKMGQTNNAQGQFKISSSSSFSSNHIGMLGTTVFTFTNSTAYIFKAFSVKGPFESIVTLSIEGSYDSQSLSSLQSLPSLEFSLILGKCSAGQIYDKSSAICSSCASSSYSFADPFTTQACQKCLDNAICLGGSIMYPTQGYWRIDESSENYIKCPQIDSCLGGSKDGGKNISLTGFCKEGYEGVACSSCASGYAKFGTSQSCINCKESKLYYVMFGGYLLIQAIAIIFLVKMSLKESSKKSSVFQSTLMRIVIDFVQILTLVSEFNFNFPSVVNSLYSGVSKILPTNIDALSVDCFIALIKGNNQHIFFNKILIIVAEPFVFMILAFIIWVIIFRIKRKPVFKTSDFTYNMLLTIIVIVYVLQPGLIKLVLELFNCKNYGSAGDPKYYLVYDVNVECWKHEHLAWALSVAIPTLIIGLLTPLGILAFWTRKKATKVQKVYSFIFKPYQNKALFWEIAILLRKVTLILISVFITSQYLQAYLGFLLLALYYYSLSKISPYKSPQLNLAEAISMGSSAFIMYSGLYFVRAKGMDTTSYLLFACDIISGIIFVIFVIYVSLKNNASTIQRKITKLRSKILKNKTLSQQPLQSPTSLQLNGQNDSPISTERIMSLEGLASTERFLSTERLTTTDRFMSTERFTSTERFMSTDHPFSPVIKLRKSEEEVSTIKEDNNEELLVVSPANLTQAGLMIFGSQPRESSFPVNLQEHELPPQDLDFQQFAETLKHEMRNSPRRSEGNKLDKVFKFTKQDWINELAKKNPDISKK